MRSQDIREDSPGASFELYGLLGKAFLTALLLTASNKLAESAVVDGIATLEFDQIPSDSLLLETVESAIRRRSEHRDQGESLAILPIELQRVLLLAWNVRRCFILTVLLGLAPKPALGSCICLSQKSTLPCRSQCKVWRRQTLQHAFRWLHPRIWRPRSG
jgi:hypothetical protein